MYKMSKKKNKMIVISLVCSVIVSLALTFGSTLGMPSWDDVFHAAKLTDFSYKSRDYDMSVHVIDVGKADSIYIRCKDKNILIDAGERDIYKTVNEYLRKNNVKELDLLVATHPHSDHIGGLPAIIDEFPIKRVIMPEIKEDMIPTSHSYENLLQALIRKNITAESPIPGTEFKIGDLSLTIIAPNSHYDNLNNYSVVIKAVYKNQSFLFTGDAEEGSERDILKKEFDLESTVLKVGHHGSKTSSSQAFLDKVNAKYAVISVGEDRNKLPKAQTVNRIKSMGTKLYRTDLDGTVIFLTDGEEIEVITEKGG